MGAVLDGVLALRISGQIVISALLGALAALGQAPLGLWPLTILALGIFFALLRKTQTSKRAFGLAWAAGAGYFAVALSWIVEPFLVDIPRHGWMAPFALLGVSLGFGVFWAVIGWVGFHTRRQALGFASVFILAEAVRGYAFTGFPWAQIGHVLIDTPMLHWSSFAGSLGLTFLVLIAAFGVTFGLENAWRKCGALIACVAFLWAASGPLTPRAEATLSSPQIRIVNTDEAQETRWDPDFIPANFEVKLAATAAEAQDAMPAMIVWPETSIPVLLERADVALSAIYNEAGGTPVVAGVQRFDGENFYNSLIRLNGKGDVDAIYDKHHLVPFGEYVPFGDLLARFGIFGLADTTGGGYAPGPGPQVIDFGTIGRGLALICYEAVFPQDVGGYDTRPDFLVLITNDAWFGEFSGPYQHMAQARLRSAEQGLPMIRAANSGVSAMIDATGRVTHQMGLGQAGALDAPLPPPLPATLYARLGDLPIVVAALLLFAISALRARFKS